MSNSNTTTPNPASPSIASPSTAPNGGPLVTISTSTAYTDAGGLPLPVLYTFTEPKPISDSTTDFLPTTASSSSPVSQSTATTSSLSPTLNSPSLPTTSQSSPTSSPTTSSTTTPSPNNYRTSLIAVAVVLGGLLAIAFIALVVLLIRNKRSARTRTESDSTIELKDSPDRAVRDLQNTIIGLEKTIDDRNSTIRHTQAALLRNGHSTGDAGLGDAQIRDRFTALSHSINDWVLTYFQKAHFSNGQSPDAVHAFQKAVPGYKTLIQDPRTKYLVVRAVIAEIIVEAFANGDFIGSTAYSALKQGVDIDAHETEYSEWNATTVVLLEKSPRFQSDRASAVQNLVSKIDNLTSTFAGLDRSEQRLNHLRTPIDTASKLAVTLAKQPALYNLESDQSGTFFDPDTMEDALQDSPGNILKGRRIQGTAFPAVKKRTMPEGSVVGHTMYLRKAQVII